MIRGSDNKWLDIKPFQEVSLYFLSHRNRYCLEPLDSPGYISFWKRERERCRNGYQVDGHKITGEYYFYLNYCPIQKISINKTNLKTAAKIQSFPDFWDGDYNYFWIREIARKGILNSLLPFGTVTEEEIIRINALPDHERFPILMSYYNTLGLLFKPKEDQLDGGRDLILGKSRRKGFSFKNASVAVCNFFHRPYSYTMLMAYEKKYLYPGKKTIFGKCQSYISFINEHTAWKMPSDYINNQSHIKSSYKEIQNGVEIEKGFMSEIEAVTFKDNPDAGRGADAYDIIGEEVGAWGTPGGLKNTLAAMRSSSEAGAYKTGMMTLFGTSGSLESGSVDFSDLFRRPEANGFMAFYDIWGKFKSKVEGFFFPRNLNMEGFYDSHGNSDTDKAREFEISARKALVSAGATSQEIQKRLQEESLDSSEAFSMIASNIFPVVELQAQLDKVVALNFQTLFGTPVEFSEFDGTVSAKPILDRSITPITSYRDLPTDLRGCPVIYEYPIPDASPNLYKIGYDPIRQDKGTSLASIIVWKGFHPNSQRQQCVVAEYIGRYDDPDDIDRLAEFFARFFNAKIMYENEIPSVKNFFRRNKTMHLLCLQPDAVISKNILKSRTNRVYGCHMNEALKDAGERYVKSWLLTKLDYGDDNLPITVIDQIYSIRLLEELISYNRQGNFDCVSALFMCMFQAQEEVLSNPYEEEAPKNIKYKALLETINTYYK